MSHGAASSTRHRTCHRHNAKREDAAAQEAAKHVDADKLKDDLDTIIDDIDGILEETAVAWTNFTQKGGE